jgi:hypothetical protein
MKLTKKELLDIVGSLHALDAQALYYQYLDNTVVMSKDYGSYL